VASALAALAARHPTVAPLVPHLACAVNRELAPRATALADGDELALLPPVSGGSGAGGARVARVVDRPLLLDEVVAAVTGPDAGGVVTFTGAVRRTSRGHEIVRLEYEAYTEMAERALARIADGIEASHPGTRVAIAHRVGTLVPGELAVVIAASAPHRAEAFAACREAIERLKKEAPIWKKEFDASGTAVWIGTGP
jgi:molybdopterin synthase catalytic subunit